MEFEKISGNDFNSFNYSRFSSSNTVAYIPPYESHPGKKSDTSKMAILRLSLKNMYEAPQHA